MKKHETPSLSDGLYIKFQSEVLKHLPKPEDLSKEDALYWINNGEKLKKILALLSLDPNQAKDDKKEAPILRLISKDPEIVIPQTSGRKTMADAKQVFTGHLDDDFANWNVGGRSKKQPETPVQVLELFQNATWKEMFSSLSGDLDKLVLTGHQVRELCEKHKDWLRKDGYWTFFLLKKEDKFFVADVRDGGRLYVNVHDLERDFMWYADVRRYRVVVPQL